MLVQSAEEESGQRELLQSGQRALHSDGGRRDRSPRPNPQALESNRLRRQVAVDISRQATDQHVHVDHKQQQQQYAADSTKLHQTSGQEEAGAQSAQLLSHAAKAREQHGFVVRQFNKYLKTGVAL